MFKFIVYRCNKAETKLNSDSLCYVAKIGSCVTCMLKDYDKSLTLNLKPLVALFGRKQTKQT